MEMEGTLELFEVVRELPEADFKARLPRKRPARKTGVGGGGGGARVGVVLGALVGEGKVGRVLNCWACLFLGNLFKGRPPGEATRFWGVPSKTTPIFAEAWKIL